MLLENTNEILSNNIIIDEQLSLPIYDSFEELDVSGNTDSPSYEITPETTVSKSKNFIMSHGDFSAHEQKIILIALSQYKKNLEINKKDPLSFELPAVMIRKFLGVSTNNIYAILRETATKLTNHKIHIENEANNEFEFSVPVPYCKFQNGKLYMHFEPSMKPSMDEALFNISTENLLYNFKNLKSMYSIRAYEVTRAFLKDDSCPFIKNTHRKFIHFSYDEFRLLMGICVKEMIDPKKGNREDNFILKEKYKNNSNFIFRTFNNVIQEINKYTDINLICRFVKEKARYKAVEFEISEKTTEPFIREMYTELYSDFFDVENLDISKMCTVLSYVPENSDIYEEEEDKEEVIVDEVPAEPSDNKETISEDKIFEYIEECREFLPKNIKLLQIRNLLLAADMNMEKIKFAYKYLVKIRDTEHLYEKLLSEVSED